MLPEYKLFGIILLYDAFNALADAAAFLLLLYICKYYGVSRRKAAVSAALIFAADYVWTLVLSGLAAEVSGVRSMVRVFVWAPLFAAIAAKALKIDAGGLCDMLAPSQTLCNGIARIACAFAGCCYGFEDAHGIYNAIYHKTLFPVQLWESGTALVITAVLLYIMRRKNYRTEGKLYPLMLMLFGSAQYFWEFCNDNKKIIGQVSELALHAASCFVVGAVWLIVLKAREERRAPERQVTP